ncbi:hypothetical protein ACJIZ3_007889 [Penstemon smallii]|uniref:Proteasome assembly chaperone 3 n=1 Tax=Penstemon smallii TaxID=265156 RepID=A0ABD3T976_9LAMI
MAMETSDPLFPVRQTSLCLDIQGNKTDIIISSYEDHFLVIVTQIGSMGTILHARKEEGVSIDPTFNVAVVFGKRDEPMLAACARKLIEHIRYIFQFILPIDASLCICLLNCYQLLHPCYDFCYICSNSGSSKALVLSLGLRDHSVGTLKGIVSAVIEKIF